MDQLLPTINKLQDVFSTVGQRDVIQLPQIVVVGSQSSGKSSVLENLVGRDFLPRGSNIVTRVPLELQLVHIDAGDDYAEFLHVPGKRFTDFSEVCHEIDAQTERITGPNKNISNKPINLKIYSKNVLNLTLVDLPGVTKVPVQGQPEDIEAQIRNLVLSYIKNPNSIILAVSPANNDIANSDALKIARELDPDFKRTIAVCTKLDLMDRGTDATDILTGKIIPVKQMIGVVNRSQFDIDKKTPIKEALKAEQLFFQKNYPSLYHRLGTPYLQRTLNAVLMHHIKTCLPDLKKRIKSLLNDTQTKLNALGDSRFEKGDKGAFVLQLIIAFAQAYCASINPSSYAPQMQWGMPNLLSGGAKIYNIFFESFSPVLQVLDPLDGIDRHEIYLAIRNANGTRSSLFVPEMAFEHLIKKQILRIKDIGCGCVDQVYDEMSALIFACIRPELHRFKTLKERVVSVVQDLLRRRLPETKAMVMNLVDIELAYINTNHPDFVGGRDILFRQKKKPDARPGMRPITQLESEFVTSDPFDTPGGLGAFSSAPPVGMTGGPQQLAPPHPHASLSSPAPDMFASRNVAPNPDYDSRGFFGLFGSKNPPKKNKDIVPIQTIAPTFEDFQAATNKTPAKSQDEAEEVPLVERDKETLELIQSLISSYFEIVRKNLQDTIPKSIMHFLVNHVVEQIQQELVGLLYKPEQFDELLQEDPHIVEQRKAVEELHQALTKASLHLAEVGEAKFENP